MVETKQPCTENRCVDVYRSRRELEVADCQAGVSSGYRFARSHCLQSRVQGRARLLILLLTTCASASGAASAFEVVDEPVGNLLFERTLSVNRSVNIFDTDEFDLDIRFGDQFFDPTNPVLLFDDLTVTPDDVDTTYEATVASDSVFLTAVDRLADLQNEFISLIFTEDQPGGIGEQRGWQEDFFFFGSSTSFPGIDTSEIRSITLSVDSFTLTSAASAGAVSTGPQVDLMLTFGIYGVPEPTTIGLLLVGIAAMSTVRRR